MAPTTVIRVLAPLALFAAVGFVSCGNDEAAPTSSLATTTSAVSSTAVATTTAPATEVPATEVPATEVPGLAQPAVWPAADVVFTTPESAAADFVQLVLGVPAVLGEFVAGDSRSGEIEVLWAGEGGSGPNAVRSLLLLRQLGPNDGWFVLAAVEPNVSIATPSQGDTVPAAALAVAGVGRGHEATIVVTALIAGSTVPLVEPVIAMGGASGALEPYTATVDLSAAPVGTTVMILVRGDTGLETDPGEFSAIAVVVEG